MSALLTRTDQAISVTAIARSTKKYFDKLISGEQDKYVVMRNNVPAAVLLPVADYEALLDEIEDLRIELVAIERLANPSDESELISHDDVREIFK
jgi:antitoxin StbD